MKTIAAVVALAALAWWLQRHWKLAPTTQEQLKAAIKRNAA